MKLSIPLCLLSLFLNGCDEPAPQSSGSARKDDSSANATISGPGGLTLIATASFDGDRYTAIILAEPENQGRKISPIRKRDETVYLKIENEEYKLPNPGVFTANTADGGLEFVEVVDLDNLPDYIVNRLPSEWIFSSE